MDAWEEPSVNEHEIPASDAANDNATSVNNSEKLPVELKNLSHESKELMAGKHEPLTHEFEITKKVVAVKTESIHDKPTNSASDDIPVTRTLALENPTHDTVSKWANLSGQRSSGFSITEAVNTKLSMDYSIPPGFDHCFNSRASKESVSPATKHEFSFNTSSCMGNGLFQSGVSSDKIDDKDMTKMELTSNQNKVEGMVKMELTSTSVNKEIMHDASRSDGDKSFGYGNSQSGYRAGSGANK
ncbi:uncharacterized protein LOC143560881 [Bidens hawaiensis]|uniref:uncharacterized protein LOC143560881 n=1 Tax=Bidens hawaiensis TaxID=980011 RepID=UPI00404B70D0